LAELLYINKEGWFVENRIENMTNTGKTLLTFLTGAAAGAIAGILLAPKSGKETRQLLSSKASE